MRLSLLLLCILPFLIFTCGHDELEHKHGNQPKMTVTESPPTHGRVLQSQDFVPMQIYPYLNDMDTFVEQNQQLTASHQVAIKNLYQVLAYIEAYVRVFPNRPLATTGGTCSGVQVPSMRSNTDFHLYVYPEKQSDTSYFAAAAACYQLTQSKRPVGGVYFLNLFKLKTQARDDYSYFHVFLHEFFHLLGFEGSTFQSFPSRNPSTGAWSFRDVRSNRSIDGVSYKFIELESVTAFAKSYYSCNTLTGLPLENEGGSGSSGSHWEKLFMFNEFMNPTTDPRASISQFTLQVLRETGHYIISEEAAQDFSWGANDGCNHFKICPQSQTTSESCTVDGRFACSADFTSYGTCGMSSFSNSCLQKQSSRSYCDLEFDKERLVVEADEAVHITSSCFEWGNTNNSSYVNTKCHKNECLDNNSKIKIALATGQEYTCTTSHEVIAIPGQTSTIQCPNIGEFCKLKGTRCSDDCMRNGNGLCLKGNKCFCFFGSHEGKCISWLNFKTSSSGAIALYALLSLSLILMF